MPGPWASLGAAADGDAAVILMPDLSIELIAWDRPGRTGALPVDDLDRVLGALATLHAQVWPRRWRRPAPGSRGVRSRSDSS